MQELCLSKRPGQIGMPTSSGTKSKHLEDIAARRSRLLSGRVSDQRASTTNRLTGMLKLLLPAIAVAIIGLTFAWSQLMPEKGKFRLGEASIANVGVEGVVMENPRYHGVDSQNHAYQISASQAIQKNQTDKLIFLEHPKADIFLLSDNWAAINSRNGIYDKSLQEVKLFGDVHIYYDRGFELKTDSIKLDLRQGTAISSDKVYAFGPGSEIHAEGLQIIQKGKHVKFLGKSKAKFLVSRNIGS